MKVVYDFDLPQLLLLPLSVERERERDDRIEKCRYERADIKANKNAITNVPSDKYKSYVETGCKQMPCSLYYSLRFLKRTK